MTSPQDPSEHRQREEQFIQHVEKLLTDDRLRLDTSRGRRPVTTLIRDLTPGDRTVELTRQMSEMNKPDRDLRNRMPRGQFLDVTLSRKQWFVFRKSIGQLKVLCISPTQALLSGGNPAPLAKSALADTLRQLPSSSSVPTTVVIMSTSGFDLEAHELADRRSDRTVVLASPNDSGGWTIIGPPETKGLADLFDPEADAEKRRRVREAIEESRVDLTGSGLSGERIAAKTKLPPTLVEAELKQYARENSGLVAKRLDGKMVLFRQSAAPVPAAGGFEMPLIDRMKALFARKGETEKKIAFLAERRTALSQQRDHGYEEMGELESREASLRQEFAATTGALTKRRITGQLLQLRKDIERRQQLLAVWNQQINVVATHLHNLELVQQGKVAHLPDSDEMAQDAAAAEEMIAELQANTELADSVGGTLTSGMSAEEQALFEELEQASNPKPKAAEPTATAPATEQKKAEPNRTAETQRRATPEAG